MKYCSKCGKELVDDAVICVACGCAVAAASSAGAGYAPQETESSALATCALVFSVLMPVVGLILGIIGYSKYANPKYKGNSKCAIVLAGAILALWFIGAMATISSVL